MKYVYLHGFASHPSSRKAIFFRDRLQKHGVVVDAVDLRVPTLETLRLSAMIDAARDHLPADDRAVVIGSSLGGLTAARLAERDERVAALVLLAPAFGLAQRWITRLGDDGYRRWRDSGWLSFDGTDPDAPARLDIGFIDDALAVDHETPDVRVPTLVLHGTRDDVVPIESSRAWVRDQPHRKLVELDDGHPLYDTLEEVWRESERFLFNA
jgi:pimeloyl-ACP methyl ester carboxylesterase